LAAQLSAATARLDRLPRTGDRPGANELHRTRFGLGELRRDLLRLADDLRAAAPTASGSAESLLDHPAGLNFHQNRYEAELDRRRWIALAGHARRRAMRGVLDALNDSPNTARYERGYAWAAVNCRLARSELVRAGGVRAGRGGREVVADPLMEFLRTELDKARQSRPPRDYAESTRMYLDLMGDYLRY
jgi:hypothetical protein